MTDDNLHADIDDLIRVTDDAKDRAMILIMQRILSRVEKALDDDTALQAKVLVGLVPFHKTDHDLINTLREIEAVDAIKWANEFRATDVAAVCAFSRDRMIAAQDGKQRLRRQLDSALFEVGKTAVYLILGAAAYAFLTGFPLLQNFTK